MTEELKIDVGQELPSFRLILSGTGDPAIGFCVSPNFEPGEDITAACLCIVAYFTKDWGILTDRRYKRGLAAIRRIADEVAA